MIHFFRCQYLLDMQARVELFNVSPSLYLSNALLSHADVNLPQFSGEVIHLDYTEIFQNSGPSLNTKH